MKQHEDTCARSAIFREKHMHTESEPNCTTTQNMSARGADHTAVDPLNYLISKKNRLFHRNCLSTRQNPSCSVHTHQSRFH